MEEKSVQNKKISIKEVRQMVRLSQSKASKVLGIPLKTLQNWEQEIRECPEWLKDIVIEKLFEWSDKDFEENKDKYTEQFLNNNYKIRYIEYGKEKELEADATGGTVSLKKALDYWQGAYRFEYCSAPTIIEIVSPKGKKIMEKYIEIFNSKSEEITNNALDELNYQDMSWAKPKSTKDILNQIKNAQLGSQI